MKSRLGAAAIVELVVLVALAGCGHPRGAAHGTEPPPAVDAAVVVVVPDANSAASVDSDGDGIPDDKDLCPWQPMVMSGGCEPARQQGCPDDCRPPLNVREPMR